MRSVFPAAMSRLSGCSCGLFSSLALLSASMNVCVDEELQRFNLTKRQVIVYSPFSHPSPRSPRAHRTDFGERVHCMPGK